MERMAAILRSHGKRPAVWNEAVRTGAFARECRVHGWESVKACLDATAKGYRTVVMPGQYFYFDMRQSPREDGHDWAAIFDAKKVYGFGFTEFSPEQMRNVEGLQGAFFSEAYVSHEPEKPTTSTTCSFRASAPSHASPGAATPKGGTPITRS